MRLIDSSDFSESSKTYREDGLYIGQSPVAKLFWENDWSRHALGGAESWPVELKQILNLIFHARQPMFVWWGKDLHQFYNDAYVPSFGNGKHPTALGQSGAACWPEIWEIIYPQIELVMSGRGATWNEDHLVPIFRNGKIEEVYWTYGYSPIIMQNGQVGGVLGVCTETTKQIESTRKLRESSYRLSLAVAENEAVLESMSDAYVAINSYWRITSLNSKHEELSGIQKHAQLHESFKELFFPTDESRSGTFWKACQNCMSERVADQIEEYSHQFGIWLTCRIFPRSDGGISVFYDDISERKFTEEDVSKISNPKPVFSGFLKRSGYIEAANVGFAELRNFKCRDHFSNLPWWAQMPAARITICEALKLAASGKPQNFEVSYQQIHLEIPIRGLMAIELTPDYNQDKKLVGITVQCFDVTARSGQVRALIIAKAKAEKSDLSKTSFLANMSHEIRTPLGAIIGFADLCKNPRLNCDERYEYLNTITRNGENLSILIDEILDLSKIESDRLEVTKTRVHVEDVINDVITLLRLKAGLKHLELSLSPVKNSVDIISDPLRIRQIIMNLVGNAVKFTDSGSVKVELVYNKKDESEGIQLADMQITVSDTGVGITQAGASKLFQQFSQADATIAQKFGGTGLGLALSRKLARLMGGDVVLRDSKAASGSVFEFSLYNCAIEQIKVPAQARPSTTASLDNIRVLIVDDAVDNRKMISLFLQLAGASVTCEENGRDGVFAALSGEADIVLMDLQMPIMNGYEAMEELRKKHFSRPVLALTANAMASDKAACYTAGFSAHLQKPINRTELINMVYQYGRQLQ